MMRRSWIIALLVMAGTCLSASALAQPDDNPYAEPAAQPRSRPANPGPAAVPVAPPAETRGADPAAAKTAEPEVERGEVAHADPHARGDDPNKDNPSHGEPTAVMGQKHHDDHATDTHGHAAPKAGGHDTHGGHGDAHGDAHGGHHGPGEMNWIYGFIGTDAEAEPSLLWRKPDMPPPFLANIINFIVFAYVVVRFGKKPLQESLKNRKLAIMKDIDAATKMKEEAAKRLEKYEDKLQHIDDEIERIKKDFREQGEREKERIIADAKEKKERMLKDAQFMIEQEVKQMRTHLMRETVEAAMKAAEEALVAKVSADDQDRVAEDYIKQLSTSGMSITKGGSA